jgi:hypothetical protein
VAVFINGEEMDRFQTHDKSERRIDTSAYLGKQIELRLSVHSLGRPGSAVAVGGGFE